MIKRELAVFLVVGSLTVLIDFLTYRGLVWTGWMNVDLAKAIGFLTGTLFAYFANKVWTFGHQEHAPGSVWRFALLYAITLSTNVLVNAACLALLSTMSIAVQIAFLIATGVSAILNFLGMKLFVFKSSDLTEKS
ncbi:GtrA family protein [Pseudomonas sp. FP1740]|jgi:putative flippase GtrA|uniref:GtrA family protein n=1 Tax=Pseudomonas sp. FP1740 TaxID=2954078 RepID=UPI00273481F1|nr:GtrA family protein [Pseudomonas sp. FP1740]WLG43455.1 GtrA family protein [Pseudomonas sp. FP1740]